MSGQYDLTRVGDCLKLNALGDAILFRDLHGDRFIYDASAASWMEWQGNRWDMDITERVHGAVEDVAEAYAALEADISARAAEAQADGNTDEAKRLENRRKKAASRVDRLRGSRGRAETLTFARTMRENPMCVRGDEWDVDPDLLVCPNGVLDLTTGALRPGRREDWCRKSTAVEWDESAECPTWERFLHESTGDPEAVAFLQRFFGYCLTGNTDEQKYLILSGEGRNGKGVLVETIMAVLGDYACPIPSEMLLDQGKGGRNPGGPSPDVMMLRGRRLVSASESDEGRRISTSRIKSLISQDTQTGRNPHDKFQTSFVPTHHLILQTNNLPYAPADDFAFWERTINVHFPFQFVAKPNPDDPRQKLRDDRLLAKLRSELPGILVWMVKGLMLYLRDGLKIPQSAVEAVEEYRRGEDQIQDWMEQCLGWAEGSEVSALDLYTNFKAWFQQYHGARCPSMNWWSRRMTKKMAESMGRLGKTKRATSNYYTGLVIVTHAEDMEK